MPRIYLYLLSDKTLSLPDGLLSEYRREKLMRQTNALVRKQSIAAELLLLYALRDCAQTFTAPLPIRAGKYGKPEIEGADLHFSLSHSDQAVLCAIGAEELGADIQKNACLQEAVMKRCYSDEEQHYVLRAEEPDLAYTEIWTMKESYCKYLGEGLHKAPASFNVFDSSLYPCFQRFTIEEYQIALFSPENRISAPQLQIVSESALCL